MIKVNTPGNIIKGPKEKRLEVALFKVGYKVSQIQEYRYKYEYKYTNTVCVERPEIPSVSYFILELVVQGCLNRYSKFTNIVDRLLHCPPHPNVIKFSLCFFPVFE